MGPGERVDLPPVSHGGASLQGRTVPEQEPSVAVRAQLKHSCPEGEGTGAEDSVTRSGQTHGTPCALGRLS